MAWTPPDPVVVSVAGSFKDKETGLPVNTETHYLVYEGKSTLKKGKLKWKLGNHSKGKHRWQISVEKAQAFVDGAGLKHEVYAGEDEAALVEVSDFLKSKGVTTFVPFPDEASEDAPTGKKAKAAKKKKNLS